MNQHADPTATVDSDSAHSPILEMTVMEPDSPTGTPPVADSEGSAAPAKKKRVRRRKSAATTDSSTPPATAEESGEAAPAKEDRAEGENASTTSPESGSDSAPEAGEANGEPGSGRRKRRRRRRRRGKAALGPDGQPLPPAAAGGSPPPQAAPEPIEVEEREGVIEIDGGEGRLRQFSNGFVASPADASVSRSMIDRHRLRPCQKLRVKTGRLKGQARPAVLEVLEVEGLALESYFDRPTYPELTPLDPQPRIELEYPGCPPANRLIDLFCPIGFGTRGLIVAPPKAGKTILLKDIAAGIKHNYPEVELVALLIDERPEEVTDFRRNVPATVLASSNDQDVEAHITLGIAAIERAKRLVEAGRDVVVLLDSLTRLGRAFNNSRRFGSGGRTMSGGLDSRALEVPKQLFGAARKAEEGGSLTIIASCLVDTGSRADQIIFEEFKGTGNMELILDRSISEKRVFPAINLAASGTRKEHLLLSERELKTITALRRRLLSLPPAVQIEQLLAALKRFETNERLVAG